MDDNIFICAIDLIINDHEPMNSSLITSDESMVISPNSTIDVSFKTRRNKSRTRRRGRKLGPDYISTPIYQNMNEESSLMTSDMSQVTEISNHNELSDSMLGERSQEEEMGTSTRYKTSDLLLGEKSQRSTNSKTSASKHAYRPQPEMTLTNESL